LRQIEVAHAAAVERSVQAEREAQAERLHREEQDKLFAMVTHEIRTPLAVIDAATQSLIVLDPEPSVERAKRYERVRRSVDRLSAVLDLSLAQAGLDLGNWKPEMVQFDAQQLTRDVFRLVASTHPSGCKPRWTKISRRSRAISERCDSPCSISLTTPSNTPPGDHPSGFVCASSHRTACQVLPGTSRMRARGSPLAWKTGFLINSSASPSRWVPRSSRVWALVSTFADTSPRAIRAGCGPRRGDPGGPVSRSGFPCHRRRAFNHDSSRSH